MKCDREWVLVFKPLGEIMQSIKVKAGERLSGPMKLRIDELRATEAGSPDMKIRYYEGGKLCRQG